MAKHGDKLGLAAAARIARQRNVRLVKVFAAIIAVCAAFAIGFVVRGDAPLLASLGFTSLVVDVDQNPGLTASGDTYNSIGARVEEVEGIIQDDSLDTYDLDTATTGVLSALAASTQDPYLSYFDSQRYNAMLQDNSSGASGIGVLFAEYNGRAYAADIFDGSAAQAAGVEQGDFVVAIDGNRDHDWTSSEVLAELRREDGASVVITWRRAASLDDEGGEEYTRTIVCSNATVQNVNTELTDNVGYIQLRQITQNASSLVRSAISDLESQGATSFVLDLRDNPGGYLTQSVDIASLFVKSGTLVRIQTKEAEETTKTATGAVATDKPLVVLVNDKTAAAAEVLAAALKDNQYATLVGTTTLGKGSVQVTRDLSFGGALRYTAAYYTSPLGHAIDGAGVTPDIAVGRSGDDDNQKTLAIETAQSLAGN